MRQIQIGPVAVLALGAIALWWLYRRARRLEPRSLAELVPGADAPIVIDRSRRPIFIEPVVLH